VALAAEMRVAGWSLASRRRPAAAPPSHDHEEDRQLVQRMLAGDGEARDAFGERYGAAVYRFAARRLHGQRQFIGVPRRVTNM